jgi:protoporphyrinogen oxidase
VNILDSNKLLPIIVLGAGPAGLTAARTLSRNGRKVIVLEKRPEVGGISSSSYWEGFIVEFGPHTYHVKHDEIDRLVREHCDSDLPIKKRVTNMLIRGKYYDYPLKFWQLLRGLNPLFSLWMVADFIFSTVKFTLFPRPDDSFETWGIKRFGKTLYNLCFGQYSRRVWGIPPAFLSTRLASSKLQKLNLKDILIKLLGGKGQEQATYWDDFIYPEEGIGVVFERMSEKIKEEGGDVWLESQPTAISFDSKQAVSVRVRRKDEELTIPCAGVISTIPLPGIADLCRPLFSEEEYLAGEELKSRSLVLANIIINTDRISRAHWVYLLDPVFRFNRFCEQKNLLLDRKPKGKTLITFELCCEYNDSLWKSTEEELRKLALKDIEYIDKIDGQKASACIIKRTKDAYPIYDLDFECNLEILLAALSRIDNLYSTGRQGLFLNTDMHDSMKSGLMAARAVLAGQTSQEWYRAAGVFK